MIKSLTKGIIDTEFVKSVLNVSVSGSGYTTNCKNQLLLKLISEMSEQIFENWRYGKLSRDVIYRLFDAHLFDYYIPECYGGNGGRFSDFIDIIKKIAEYDIGLAVTAVPHSSMGIGSILRFGTESQKKMILGNIVKNKSLIAFALTEGGVGSDVTRIQTKLTLDFNGKYFLSGSKVLITNAKLADSIIVVARCPQMTRNPSGMCFVHINSNNPNLVITTPYDKLSVKTSNTCELQLNDIEVQFEDIIGIPGKGIEQFNTLVKGGRIGVAAGAFGITKRALSLFANQTSPLLIDMDLEMLRMESMLNVTSKSYEIDYHDSSILSALTKVFCTQTCLKILKKLLVSEGLNFEQRHQIAQHIRDASILQITEGPNDPVAYKCALEIMMSDVGERQNSMEMLNTILPIQDQGQYQDILLEYSDIIMIVSQSCKPLSGKQKILTHVMSATTALYSWVCTMIYLTIPEKRVLYSGDQIASYSKKIRLFTMAELKRCNSEIHNEVENITDLNHTIQALV